MKKLIKTTLIWMLVFICSQVSASPDITGLQLTAENQHLALYIDTCTTEIVVVDKASQQAWYSNPPNWNELELQARGSARDKLGAQIVITYDRSDRQNRETNNYSESIVHGLYEISQLDDGVRVEYSLGRKWSDEDYLPIMIEHGRMETLIFAHISERDQRDFTNRFHLVYLREHTEIAPLTLQGINMDKVLNGYEFVVVDDRAQGYENQLADLRMELQEADVDQIADIEEQISRIESQLNGYKSGILRDMLDLIYQNIEQLESMDQVEFMHLEQLVDTPTYFMGRVPVFARTNLIEAVMSTDYTPEQATQERIANNLDPLQPNIETFFIPLEYRLDDKSLVVTLPMEELVYPLDVEDNQGQSHTYPLHTLNLLPYFGAAYHDQAGYIFMPDGCGALIDFDSYKYTLGYIGQPVYGRDLTADNRNQQLVINQQTYMPVYGLKSGNKAYLAIIEHGDALARISAAKAGFVNSYNYVGPQFDVMPKTNVSLGPIGSVDVYQKRIYQGDIQIRFYFLTGDQANYFGMAKTYQNYLVETYRLSAIDSEQSLPFYLNIVGSIIKNEPVLGVPREVVRPLTTFAQTAILTERLQQLGVANLAVKYNGWLKGGPEHIFPTKIVFEKAVGGREEFEALAQSLCEQSIAFYPEIGFLNVYRNHLFDSFNIRRDAAQFFDHKPRRVRLYDIAFGLPEAIDFYLLSARSLERTVQSFLHDYDRYNLSGIALECMGRQVNSDFRNRDENVVDRQQAAEVIKQQLALIADNYDILVTGANALAYPFVNDIIEVPFTSSQHEILDKAVPFLQLVLNGYINFAGEPLNLADDYRHNLLTSIAIGAGLHYQWAYQNTNMISNSDYDHLYSVKYQDWIEQAADDYQKAAAIHAMVAGSDITHFLDVDPNSSLTIYENGCRIVVDYDNHTVTVYHTEGGPKFYQF